jgi:pimeloyl-ACP methyl ester carboxylesterase
LAQSARVKKDDSDAEEEKSYTHDGGVLTVSRAVKGIRHKLATEYRAYQPAVKYGKEKACREADQAEYHHIGVKNCLYPLRDEIYVRPRTKVNGKWREGASRDDCPSSGSRASIGKAHLAELASTLACPKAIVRINYIKSVIWNTMNVGKEVILATSIVTLITLQNIGAQDLRRSGFFGIVSAELSSQDRKQLPAGTTGIAVKSVIAGGSAKDGGIEPSDILTEINGHKIVDVADFVDVVRRLHSGELAAILIIRNGQQIRKELTVKPRPYESAPDVETVYRSVSVDGTLRRVIVTVPKTPGKHPALLYINGIGCFSQESADLSSNDAKLLYGLTRAGFVTMRVEKSGIGDSEGPSCMSASVDLAAERRGYVGGLKALKEYSFVDPSRIFLIGISIGGIQAPLVAEEVPVEGIVVINTVIKPFLEYLIDTRRRQNMLAGVPFDEVDRRARLNEVCNHRLLIEKRSFDEVVKADPTCLEYITYPAAYTYMQQWAALDPATEWKRVSSSVLIVYGTADFVSTIADDPMMADVINSFHPGHATLKAIPNMDHTMFKAASMQESMNWPADKPREFEPAVLEAIKTWLQQQASSVIQGASSPVTQNR